MKDAQEVYIIKYIVHVFKQYFYAAQNVKAYYVQCVVNCLILQVRINKLKILDLIGLPMLEQVSYHEAMAE